MTKVRCSSCGSEMPCPPGMETAPVHICVRCYEHQPPTMASIPSGRAHIEIDPRSLVEPPKGTLMGREDEYLRSPIN
jgi:hypothetical protein